MGEFNSDDHYIYYCGQDPLAKWSSPHSQQESEMQYLDAISKMTEWSLFISKANHSISWYSKAMYALTSNAEEAGVEWFYEDLQDLLELTPKRDVLSL